MKAQEIDNAIAAHLNWIVRFENIFLGDDRRTLNIKQLRDDTFCEFGHWLQDNPTFFTNADLYERIKSLHKSFHEEAAIIAEICNDGLPKTVTEVKRARFDSLSHQLIDALYDAKYD